MSLRLQTRQHIERQLERHGHRFMLGAIGPSRPTRQREL
jgi:hypothetical protein